MCILTVVTRRCINWAYLINSQSVSCLYAELNLLLSQQAHHAERLHQQKHAPLKLAEELNKKYAFLQVELLLFCISSSFACNLHRLYLGGSILLFECLPFLHRFSWQNLLFGRMSCSSVKFLCLHSVQELC